jgi:hypothetical protein
MVKYICIVRTTMDFLIYPFNWRFYRHKMNHTLSCWKRGFLIKAQRSRPQEIGIFLTIRNRELKLQLQPIQVQLDLFIH